MSRKYKIIFFIIGGSLVLFVVANLLWANLKYRLVTEELPPPEVPVIVETPRQREKMEPDLLLIQTLQIRAPIIYVDEISEDLFQQALQHGVVHFPGTALPGHLGNVYIFGHSSDNLWAKGDYKTVFAVLPEIKIDDLIEISDPEGYKFVYKVKETKVVAPNEVQYLDQRNNEYKLLTLQTSYPVGTAFKRFIVIAELVE
ncbi:MAG: sortase [Candidatus Doudnabacteria bacterium]|nr:sortase [Candidatus Doudnabacteria bacterium]